jgi:hypothetical protein
MQSIIQIGVLRTYGGRTGKKFGIANAWMVCNGNLWRHHVIMILATLVCLQGGRAKKTNFCKEGFETLRIRSKSPFSKMYFRSPGSIVLACVAAGN